VIRAGIKAREIRLKTDPRKLATLISSFLEGGIMVYRLERDDQAMRAVRAHLENYLESEMRTLSNS